jgi:hypothetical protein
LDWLGSFTEVRALDCWFAPKTRSGNPVASNICHTLGHAVSRERVTAWYFSNRSVLLIRFIEELCARGQNYGICRPPLGLSKWGRPGHIAVA